MEITELLELAVKQNASDLHLLPESTPLFRIDGELVAAKDMPKLSAQEVKGLIYTILSKQQLQEFEKNLQFDIAVSFGHIGNFRASIYHQMRGVAAVFRVIPEKIPTFEELNLPQVLKSLLVLSNGLILVTGPAGSGKSTTLAAMIEYINNIRSCNIITIEDPIEYIYTSKRSAINQIQLYRDTPSFAAALRASLRQDPNVILLGEMRDLETMRLALTAAETGHLVMATLHASSAPLAISRIVDSFPNAEKNRVRNLLSETIQAISCQMLVKKMSGGRIGAFEIMLATRAIRHQIRQDRIAHMSMTMQTNGDIGMCTMDQYLDDLVAKRLVSVNVARSAALNRGAYRYAIG
jgi:twitching motility protein PilT